MKKIREGFVLPSAALTIKRNRIKYYTFIDRVPQAGDVVYGTIARIGQHSNLENASGRIHMIFDSSKAVFVFGNRYAPDYYEGLVPETTMDEVDLLARSGMIGVVKTKNTMIKDPTRVKIMGYVCDDSGRILNTRDYPLIKPKTLIKKHPRAKMILVCGTSMNSGKSVAAAACCWALSSSGYDVRACKVTGTAGLKDILMMNDAGARPYADFSYLGYPSTYLLAEDELLSIFNRLDLKHANDPRKFWVVEIADGIIQRETRMLLNCPDVISRIHRLIFCAGDAFGAIGGLEQLKLMGLKPDALSGICSSSPLHVRELEAFTDIPVFNSAIPDVRYLSDILVGSRRDTQGQKTAG